MTAPTPRRGRPSAGRTDAIEIRVHPDQRASYQAAAEARELSLSEWIRAALDRAARRSQR